MEDGFLFNALVSLPLGIILLVSGTILAKVLVANSPKYQNFRTYNIMISFCLLISGFNLTFHGRDVIDIHWFWAKLFLGIVIVFYTIQNILISKNIDRN